MVIRGSRRLLGRQIRAGVGTSQALRASRLACGAFSTDHTGMLEENEEGDFLGGRMLIAMPGIGDPRFERSVILMCAHSPFAAMGIAVNRPVEGLSLSELLEKLGVKVRAAPALGQPVLAGGPVDRERGFVLHTSDFATTDSTLPVTEAVSLTPTREVLEAIVDEERRPRCSVLALGCAEWSAGQLEQEIRESVWLSCEADEALIFDEEHETKWTRALAKIGVRADQLSARAGRA
jgi:putative transcriptional regulator